MKASFLKCSIVGDTRVGKTRLTKNFVGEKEDETYIPTIFENYHGETVCNGKKSSISIFDLPGQHDFDQMRRFALKDSNVIVVCYDVQKRTSFENAQSVWIPEIRQFLGKSFPIVLVGILTMGKQTRSVSRREAIEVTSHMLLHDYFEVYCEDKVEVSCLFSCVATIAKNKEKRNASFIRRIFIK